MQRRRNRAKINTVNWQRVRRRTANTTNEVRLDIKAHGIWERAQQVFLDLRAFDPDACRYLNKSLQKCHVMNDQEKKRAYNERVFQMEHGTFTPLFFFNLWKYGEGMPYVLFKIIRFTFRET